MIADGLTKPLVNFNTFVVQLGHDKQLEEIKQLIIYTSTLHQIHLPLLASTEAYGIGPYVVQTRLQVNKMYSWISARAGQR
jgi:hypothetical protein